MKEIIPDRVVRANQYDYDITYPSYKHDRNDVYKPCRTFRDERTLSMVVFYNILSVECNPDIDW